MLPFAERRLARIKSILLVQVQDQRSTVSEALGKGILVLTLAKERQLLFRDERVSSNTFVTMNR